MSKTQKNIDKITNDTIPQFDLPIDFIAYDNVTVSLLNAYSNFPCKIESFILAFVEKGHVKASINLWEYNIEETQVVVLIPGSFIQIKEVSDDTKINFVGFSSAFLKRVNFWKCMSQLLMPIFKVPLLKVDKKYVPVYLDTFKLLTKVEELDEETSLFSEECIKSLFAICADLLEKSIQDNVQSKTNSITNREEDIVAEFMQLAFENYREEHKISFYAHEANLTLSHFCNVISKSTGMTPQEIIMHLIIMDAKTQLKGTDSTVSKIASTLGFATPTTFNRYFRTYTGQTPQEYRFG